MNDRELHIRLLVAESEINRRILAGTAAVWLRRIRMVDHGLGLLDSVIAMVRRGDGQGSTAVASIIGVVLKACSGLPAGAGKTGDPPARYAHAHAEHQRPPA